MRVIGAKIVGIGVVGVGLLLSAIACRAEALPTPAATIALPTSSALTQIDTPEPTSLPTSTSAVELEQAPTNTAVPPTTTPTETAVPTSPPTATPLANTEQASYAVIFVEPNDQLNVRSGPGVAFGIVGTLPPAATDVQIVGSGQVVAGSTWVPVQRGGVNGWVNSRFLTRFIPGDAFCKDTAVLQLLDRLQTAVSGKDDALIAQLVHPERGLRVRLVWHESETWLDSQNLFNDAASYNWGTAVGSGLPIEGTPAEVLLPRLEADLVGATETACNQILHGGTAGFVVLPDAHAPINYYSFHRPGTEEFAGLNWGSWVVGIEHWQGEYYLSTLVHFQWEP